MYQAKQFLIIYLRKDYYQKKRAEGKHHKTCIGAVAKKLCNIIYSVLKNNTPYKVPKQ